MKELFNLINELRNRIEKYRDLLSTNEALTRYVLIDPILRVLSWDTENPDIVRPEERQDSGRPDYVLYYDGKKLIALEAKSLGSKIDEKKVLDLGFSYSWKNKIPYFIITDGNMWKIYDVKKMGGELILEVNILKDPIEDIVRKFLSLWRPLIKHEIKHVKIVTMPSLYTPKEETEIQAEKLRVKEKVFIGPINSRQAEFLVLYVLNKSKRPMKRGEIIKEIEKIVELTDYDKETLKSGTVRWKATVEWAFYNLKEKSLIERVRYGVWKITSRGISELKELDKR